MLKFNDYITNIFNITDVTVNKNIFNDVIGHIDHRTVENETDEKYVPFTGTLGQFSSNCLLVSSLCIYRNISLCSSAAHHSQ